MLLNNRMASIPCANRHSVSYLKDIQCAFRHDPDYSTDYLRSSSPTAALQYFNMRVTQRLHRYRSLKRQWQEVATSIHYPCQSSIQLPGKNFPDINASIQDTPKAKSPSKPRKLNQSKSFNINDVLNPTANNHKEDQETNHIELDPLHTRIQQDLIKLRKFIKNKQGKFYDGLSPKGSVEQKYSDEMTTTITPFEEQENRQIPTTVPQQVSPPQRLKPLDRVKIAGSQMRRPTLVKSESMHSPTICTSQSSSTCSQYAKTPVKVKLAVTSMKINDNPSNASSISTTTSRAVSSKKKLTPLIKTSSNENPKQRSPSRLQSLTPIAPVVSEKGPSFTKQEILLPPICHETNDDASLCEYTYAASTSSAVPSSMLLNRNTSLLPILLHSSCCVGLQNGKVSSSHVTSDYESQQEETVVNENDNYYYLLSYKELINRLPTPIIPSEPPYGKDDYEVLFDQLNHVRETMPNNNIYDDYARINI